MYKYHLKHHDIDPIDPGTKKVKQIVRHCALKE